jgi:hypothetical protein
MKKINNLKLKILTNVTMPYSTNRFFFKKYTIEPA